MKTTLTMERLHELLKYDPATGVFTWRKFRSNHAKAGAVAGYTEEAEYCHIRIDGVLYKAHRLAWLYVYGAWPNFDIDHINQNKADNRIKNLREVNRSQNMQNVSISKGNKSGLRGVSWAKHANKWRACIHVNYKSIHLGYFKTAESAYAAYVDAARAHHSHNAHVGSQ